MHKADAWKKKDEQTAGSFSIVKLALLALPKESREMSLRELWEGENLGFLKILPEWQQEGPLFLHPHEIQTGQKCNEI